MRSPRPADQFDSAGRIAAFAGRFGRQLAGSFVVEIGAGWDMSMAVGLWLGGADRIWCVDQNRHLRQRLLADCLRHFREHPAENEMALGPIVAAQGFAERKQALFAALATRSPSSIPASVEYRAPIDCTCLPLADNSADFHVSRSVFEHVPPDAIVPLLAEGRRIVKRRGLLVHAIDFSDHFSHSDPGISSIHFLRYTERDWNHYAGNRFMYHNRLRVDAFEGFFEAAGLRLLAVERDVDPRALREIASGFVPDPAFRGGDADTLATANAWFVAEPA